jgi:hypothetical protein
LLVFATADGILLTASTFSADRRALIETAAAAPDQGDAEIATLFSAPPTDAPEVAQAPSLVRAQEALPEGNQWFAAVDTLEQLIAQQKAFQAPAIKPAQNNEVLGRLEAWVNTRTQNSAATAQACTAWTPHCRKGAILIQ